MRQGHGTGEHTREARRDEITRYFQEENKMLGEEGK